MEDVGAMTYQENLFHRALQPGLFRNIISAGALYPDGYSNTFGMTLPEQKCFNLTQTYGNGIGGIGQIFEWETGEQVFNFCVNTGYTGGRSITQKFMQIIYALW